MFNVTNIDVRGRSEIELRVLFGMVTQAIARAEPGSEERQIGQTNLDNVSRALRHKFATPTRYGRRLC